VTRTVVQDEPEHTIWEGQWSLPGSSVVRQFADCEIVYFTFGPRLRVEFWNDDWFEMDHGGNPGVKDKSSFYFPLGVVLVVCEVEL